MTPERALLKRLVELKDAKVAITLKLSSADPQRQQWGREEQAAYLKDRQRLWAEARALLAQPEDFAQQLFNRSTADLWREYCALKEERDALLAQAKRKPLTYDQIERIAEEHRAVRFGSVWPHGFARALERKHEIE